MFILLSADKYDPLDYFSFLIITQTCLLCRFRVTKSDRKDFTDYVNVERDKENCRIAMDEFKLG